MRMYKKNNAPASKHWSIDLQESASGAVNLVTVDATTGELIGFLMTFKNGQAVRFEDADIALESEDYDPKEHGNKFDDEGRLVIIDGEPSGEVPEEDESPF